MKQLWLDVGNTRLKYWITDSDQIIEHAAELHLQSPADLLLGLIQHFKNLNIQQIGVSSVQDKKNNDRIRRLLKSLNNFVRADFEKKLAQEGFKGPVGPQMMMI